MEPLSSTASVIIIVASLVIQICDGLRKIHHFWRSVENAPDDIARLVSELSIFERWLSIIANGYQRQSFTDDKMSEEAAIDTLKHTLERI